MKAKRKPGSDKFLIYTTGNNSEKLWQRYRGVNLEQTWKTANGRFFRRILNPRPSGGWTEADIIPLTRTEAADYFEANLSPGSLASELLRGNFYDDYEYA